MINRYYIIELPEKPILIDIGVAYTIDYTIKKIKQVLGIEKVEISKVGLYEFEKLQDTFPTVKLT